MNGYADLVKNLFTGTKSHELTIVILQVGFADIRRFAVSTIAEAHTKCAEFGVTPRF